MSLPSRSDTHVRFKTGDRRSEVCKVGTLQARLRCVQVVRHPMWYRFADRDLRRHHKHRQGVRGRVRERDRCGARVLLIASVGSHALACPRLRRRRRPMAQMAVSGHGRPLKRRQVRTVRCGKRLDGSRVRNPHDLPDGWQAAKASRSAFDRAHPRARSSTFDRRPR
jgi:hypothetical protein